MYVQIDPRARPIVIADSPEHEEGYTFTLEDDGVEIVPGSEIRAIRREARRGDAENTAGIVQTGAGGLFGMEEYGSDMDEEEEQEEIDDEELVEEEEE